MNLKNKEAVLTKKVLLGQKEQEGNVEKMQVCLAGHFHSGLWGGVGVPKSSHQVS